MKIFKKALPVLMAAMMIVPTLSVHATELDETTGGTEPLAETTSSTGKSWNVGKNDPTEVVATYSNGVLTLENKYVYDADSGAEELPNPGLMKDDACGEINSYFASNEITGVRVVVGNGVQTIGENSFAGCFAISDLSITSSSFKEIKRGAFSNCANLTSVSINKGVVNDNAFQGSGVETLMLSDGVTEVKSGAFQGTSMTSINLPSSLKKIGDNAFADTKIESLTGGDGVTSVGNGAFSGAKKIDVATTASDAIKAYDWSGSGYTDINAGGIKQVIITYNTKGGNAIAPVTMNAGEALTPPTPTYSGMTFDGWFIDEAYTKPFADGTAVNENITLYAKWHGDYVTVTFETNNGVAATTQQVAYGGKVTKPSDPAPSGDKVFGGWFSDSACTKAFSFDTVLTADTTVYAKWGDATFYTVKFDVDGGSAIDNQSVRAGNTASRPSDPTKTDYTFDGWYKDNKWKDKWDFDKDKVNGDVTIYARFLSNKVTVKFDTRGGSSIASVVVDRGGKLTNPGNPTKDNSEFLGWYKEEECTNEFIIDSETVKDNMTLYAKWNQTAFTVKWESNGGSTIEPTTANPNALIAKPADPTKAGYYLVGWCKDSDLKNQWNFDSDKVTADITLYALWAPGDPAAVNGANPGVTNTGAKAPQTGDASNPLFHLFAAITGVGGAVSTGLAGYCKRKKRIF